MANGYIYGTTSNKYITVGIYWEELPDTPSNSSTVFATLYYKKSSASNEATTGVIKATLEINGNKLEYNSGTSKKLPTDDNWYKICEHSAVVAHNSDGKKSITIKATGGMVGSSFESTDCSGTAVLTDIPRAATLTSVSNFTDATNPTIKYSNPAGSAVGALQACISLKSDGSTADISYKSVNKTGTLQYTFSLTTAEKNTLINATSGNSRTVYFCLKTTIGGVAQPLSIMAATFSLSNQSISFSPTAYDTNSRTTALTGNSDYIVKGYSNLYYSAGASASTGASISSITATCGGVSKTTSTGTFTAAQSATINFTAKDSRGNSGSGSITKTLINYFKPTISIDFSPPDANGNMSITVNGTFYNGSFGKVANSIAATYGVSNENMGYSYGGRFDLTVSGNTFSGTKEITVEDYKQVYTIRVGCYDELEELDIEDIKATGTPAFDWGKDDFKFNVDVECDRDLSINGRFFKQNQILWDGGTNGYYMQSNQTVSFKYPDNTTARVSEQPSGIILVFSPYLKNEDWVFHFVPKEIVEKFPGSGFSFNLANAVYSNVGGKFIYIYDTYMTGWGWNDANGTGSGISYNNKNWVLRYVIGV